mgnify:CR=1 FL=1
MLNAIFDFNGTMFFDEAFQEKAWQQYMTEKLGRRITPEEFQTWIHGRNTGDTLEYFFGRPFTQQEADEEEEAEETIYRALCRQSPDYKLADGLVEFLDFLAAHKIPRTIATASCGNNVRFFFDTLGLDRWFDLDKVIYNDGTLPCVIFEDSGAGIESAQRAGAKKVVGIASMKKPAELETLGVDAVIGDYTDLGKLAKILEV